MTEPEQRRRVSDKPATTSETQRPTLATFSIIAAVVLFLYLVRQILLPFVLGAIVAYVFNPLVDWLSLRVRLPRIVFALAIVVCLIAIAAVSGLLLGPSLVADVVAVAQNLHGAVAGVARGLIGGHSFVFLGQTVDAERIADYVVAEVENWASQDGRMLAAAAMAFIIPFGYVLTWVILGYVLSDAPAIGRGLIWMVPPSHRAFAWRVWRDLDPVLRRYFIGVAVVVAYAAVAAYFGLGIILGIHHAVFLALLTGVLETIPLVGPLAAAVVAGLVAVQQSTSPWGILAYVLYASALRISIDQFIGPIVLGKAASLQPVLVMFCLLTGGLLFGVVGAILALPVALAIKSTLATLYEDEIAAEAATPLPKPD